MFYLRIKLLFFEFTKMHGSEVPTTAAVKGDVASQKRMARDMAVSSYHPQFSVSEASAFGDTLFPVENFWVRIITFSWAFLLESQRPGCWCGKTFQNKLLLSLGGMPVVSWRRASRIWSWGSGKVALLPVLLPVDSRILEKNKEADIIYSEDNREK